MTENPRLSPGVEAPAHDSQSTPDGSLTGEILPGPIKGFELIRRLSMSAATEVYVARQYEPARTVVLKLLRAPNSAQGSDEFDWLLSAYTEISGLTHPNVVRVFEIGAADAFGIVTMEYCSAGSLRGRLEQPLGVSEALVILREIASALTAIHALGVVHRDLKPSNVVLRADGTTALIDFGLARVIGAQATRLQIGGTPYYMSPEQGHGRAMDARSDLYSLGVIFYEMLMRAKPFLAPTPMGIIYKHLNSPVPSLPEHLQYLQPLLARLLAKDPLQRYASASELLMAIDALPVSRASDPQALE